jgi:hypothetical protein
MPVADLFVLSPSGCQASRKPAPVSLDGLNYDPCPECEPSSRTILNAESPKVLKLS